MNPELSQADVFRTLPVEEQERRLSKVTKEAAEALLYDWDFWARPSQFQPPVFRSGNKTHWLVQAGRGFGKTRVGAETVREWAKDCPLVNFIGATSDDVRDIMIEGESGVLQICPPGERPRYQPSKRRLVWPNGSISLLFTADEPERLRGKQHFKYWADELASWRYPEAFEQILLGLRLGTQPQGVITTTPKPTKQIKELVRDKDVIVTRGSTYDNRHNLAAAFIRRIITRFEGTRLGRQELMAELLEDNPNALWTHEIIDRFRILGDKDAPAMAKVPPLQRIVIAIDPAVTANEDSDETGIAAVGKDYRDPAHFYVLDDLTCVEKPDGWGRRAVGAYYKYMADCVVAEVNNGGDLVEANIRHQDENIAYKAVRASRGKAVRAEPISALYEQGRVHHVGLFAALEDQMCDFDPTLENQASPDRMEAVVWGITELGDIEVTDTKFVLDSPHEAIDSSLDQLDDSAEFAIL